MAVLGLDNVVMGVIFFIFALYCLLITQDINSKRQKEKDKDNLTTLQEGVFNGVLTAILCIVMGLFYFIPGLIVAFINNTIQDSLYQLYPTPTATFAIYFLGFIFLFISIFVVYEWKTKKFSKTLPIKQKVHRLDKELSRKAFHVLIIGVLAVYLIVGKLLVGLLYSYLEDPIFDYWGYGSADWSVIDGGQLVTMFGLTVAFEFVLILDLIRLKVPRYFPARILSNLYREKEKDTLGPHIYLIAGMLFAVIVFPPPIAMATIAISALGDAAATIVGVTKGKRKIKPGVSKKTWEGCIAGMIASFIFGFIGFIALVFTEYFSYVGTVGRGLVIGLVINVVAVPIFFLIDYYTPKPIPFSDNLLNPILIGFAMWGVYALFCI
ncbi:MAG: diacylglycerol/polyprenol kinase family protein [Promethearchaeota archaeon]